MAKVEFPSKRWDEKEGCKEVEYCETYEEMIELSYAEPLKAYTSDISCCNRYSEEQIRRCNIVAMSILEYNNKGFYITVRGIMCEMFSLMDAPTVQESIGILEKNGFLDRPSLEKGYLHINAAKVAGLEKLEQFFEP